jgi:secreted trypsin-like serine protease
VRLGEWNTSTAFDCDTTDTGDRDCVENPVQDIPIEKTILHPSYRATNRHPENDIALLRLSRECDYNDFVKPICLPLTEYMRQIDLDGHSLTVAGWGRTETTLESDVKLKVDVSVVPLETCKSVHGISLQTTQMCAGGEEGKDSCVGDSGGPLMKLVTENRNQFFYAAGVVSYGPKLCGTAGKPAIYTKVSEYVHWILETIKP